MGFGVKTLASPDPGDFSPLEPSVGPEFPTEVVVGLLEFPLVEAAESGEVAELRQPIRVRALTIMR
jgi:hypothetical protein